MSKLFFLGTANAIPDEQHENTHLALLGRERLILIDAPGNPTVRLKQANLDYRQITDLILTHFHPDHVSGVPSLIMNIWLLGRKEILRVHGLGHTLERIEKLMEFYDWVSWPGFYPVEFHTLPEAEMTPVLENEDFRILASPVRHMIPGTGLRIEALGSRKIVAYSCDTEPCAEVVRLAAGADVLIHEATGASHGHSSAAQAGEIARQARAKSLYLIHYRTGDFDPQALVDEARQTFSGEVTLAEDLASLDI